MKKNKGDLPERKCIVTGSVLPKAELIRCVVDPDAIVIPDVDGKLPGRGLWLSADKNVVQTATQKNAFARAARAPVKPMDGLAERIESLLVDRCLGLIGMMRRSGTVIFGFEKTRSWLKEGNCQVLISARDGAKDGRDKLKAIAGDLPVIEYFDAQELAGAVGRDHLVHMGLASGQLTLKFLNECKRLQGFRGSIEN